MEPNLKTFPDFYHKRCGHTHKEMVVWYEAFVKKLQHLKQAYEKDAYGEYSKKGVPEIIDEILGLKKWLANVARY